MFIKPYESEADSRLYLFGYKHRETETAGRTQLDFLQISKTEFAKMERKGYFVLLSCDVLLELFLKKDLGWGFVRVA